MWILVSEKDITFQNSQGNTFDGVNDEPPLTVGVVVADGQELDCRDVKIDQDNATTIPGHYGDSPLVKYRVSGGEKILGIVGHSPSRNPLRSHTIKNDHRCAQTPNTPSFEDAECYRNAV